MNQCDYLNDPEAYEQAEDQFLNCIEAEATQN